MNDWAKRWLEPDEKPTYIDFLGDLAGTTYSVGYIKQFLSNGEPVYMCWHPELAGCMTQVCDLADMSSMLQDARELWISVGIENGQEIPKPLSHLTVTR